MARGCRDGRPVHHLLVIQGRPPVPYFQSSRFRPGGFFTSGTDHAAGAAEYSGGGKSADWRFRAATAPCPLNKVKVKDMVEKRLAKRHAASYSSSRSMLRRESKKFPDSSSVASAFMRSSHLEYSIRWGGISLRKEERWQGMRSP